MYSTMKISSTSSPYKLTVVKGTLIGKFILAKSGILMERILFFALLLMTTALISCSRTNNQPKTVTDVNHLLLKNYRPESIYHIPRSKVEKAKFHILDVHSHAYAETPEMVDLWVKNMDEVGIKKTIILSMATGTKFDSIYNVYAGKYPDHFEVWCGIDYTGYDKPGFGPAAVAELERCYHVGARGVGEIGDKGKGLYYSNPGPKAWGMHPDDKRMDIIWEKCAELNMPVNIHVGDPIWMYQKMDSTNDGLMNAFEWRLDNQQGIVDNPGMLKILENTVKKHPNTKFIACHFANQTYNLKALSKLLDAYPNLYADISGRFAETAAVPRYTKKFYEKYQDRLMYGTDMGFNKQMYRITFRMLETEDEHFYEIDWFGYHWPWYGLGLSDQVLRKVYYKNAERLLNEF